MNDERIAFRLLYGPLHVRAFTRLDCLGLSDYLIAIFSGDVFGFVDVFGSANGRDVFGG